jgi:hypothetical protein
LEAKVFVGHAAHEAGVEAPARDAVDHRHLLGDADRVLPVGDRDCRGCRAAAFFVWRARIAADSGAQVSMQVAV